MTQTDAIVIAILAGIVLGTAIGRAIPRRHIAKWSLFRCGGGR